MKRENAPFVVRKLRQLKYPQADSVLLGGSTSRGENNSFSDLDVIFLYEKVDHTFRESFIFEEWPVEAFVHDLSTLRYFYSEEAKLGYAAAAHMVAEGLVFPKATALSEQAQSEARDFVKLGAPPLTPEEIAASRHAITDLVDDLREPRSGAERIAVATRLYDVLSTFYFRRRNQWSGRGKQTVRSLTLADPELAKLFLTAFDTLFTRGDEKAVIAVTDLILKPDGGFLFDGYRRDFAPTGRIMTPLTEHDLLKKAR